MSSDLSPEEKEKILSEFSEGKEISNKDYYVVKSKKGVLYVRKRKQPKQKENYLTLKQADNTFKIPIKDSKYDEGFLTIEQENIIYKIPAEEIKRKKKEPQIIQKEVPQIQIPVPEEKPPKETKRKNKAL